jgi:hypothetical protein
MAARRAEQKARETGTLHVTPTRGSVLNNGADVEWEPATTQPKPNKAQRLGQRELALLEARARHQAERLARKASAKEKAEEGPEFTQ